MSFVGFEPNETVSFTLTGKNGAGATLAVFRAAISTASLEKAAAADGTASVDVTLPTNAVGDYTLLAASASCSSWTAASVARRPSDLSTTM
ncbi:hypothetical protein ELQ92_05335 [Labedella populi]|uniref:Uncharacterized protein n=1 Tax=Labedella populi TaxID=2498850 RepID=A0A444QGB5_9MICO|nr:hypothetical protein [Labedella populi]RWZ68623.1 hypothetical protein ELQ92_05335 [Labedella populi]